VLVMTPALDGHDGVSEVSRQATAALAAAWGRDAVEVWTLAGGLGDDARVAGIRLRSARGGRARMAAWSLARSRAPLDGSLVLVMHLHLAPLAVMLEMRGASVAVFLHGIEAWTPLRRRESAALDRATALLSNSNYTAARFRDANPRFASRPIAVCHLGARAPLLRTVTPEISGYALIVGRLAAGERYKGHDALIDCWPEVVARVPGATLVIVGDGDDRGRLERLAADRGVRDRIVFAGRAPDAELAGWFQHAAFLAMPSQGEGFGLAFVEAMRAGKPCISARGAAEEIVEDGTTGIVVDATVPDALTSALVRLFSDPDGRERMGRAGAARIASMFEERHFAARLLAQLAPLMAQTVSLASPHSH
jgi:phosphatidylinositol alpha-1,6-mannosyltransferase